MTEQHEPPRSAKGVRRFLVTLLIMVVLAVAAGVTLSRIHTDPQASLEWFGAI
ncbi:hypothetical protein Q0Z83_051050 [Actinoplanes sichuanensis]|uniref:Uncharacterized protein n=1 Tax=Actinoplanes sichuanensis TaxID=512349 RepID=A0ABW4ANG7_9ACTN|nr:hypothetical protein [Actinoplanes sichuanensis]BEL06914.1 hypothetical protein Q0Z83_051050 [Actinoplanes sichuanensis]